MHRLRALAQAALRHWPVAPERVRLLLHGFNTTYRVDTVDRRRFALRPLPLFTPAQYEAVVAARNLVLLNDVLGATTAELRAVVPRYVPNTVVKLRHWLETGRYRHEVPGLI